MGFFKSKPDYSRMSLAQLQASSAPAWCAHVVGDRIEIEAGGGLWPYALRSKSFFGPNLEQWIESVLQRTFVAVDFERQYPFLRDSYIALLQGTSEILRFAWGKEVWEKEPLDAPRSITSDPFTSDPYWELHSISWTDSALMFLAKLANQHNGLSQQLQKRIPPWNAAIFEFKRTWNPVSRGIANRMQHVIDIRATPAVLEREIARLRAATVAIAPPPPPPVMCPP